MDKAQVTVGQLFIGVVIFVALFAFSFNFFLGHTLANDITLSDSINTTAYQKLIADAQENITTNQQNVEANKTNQPPLGGFDFFSAGVESIKTLWNTGDMAGQYVVFVQKESGVGKYLPESFFGFVMAIVIVTVILIVLGALWRYGLTK